MKMDVKKLLAKLLTTNTVTLTRVDNNYVNSTNFNRMAAYSKGGIGVLIFNCQTSTSMPTGTGLTQIGTMSPAPKHNILQTLACQSNTSSLLLQVTTSGSIEIANTSGVATGTNFFRATIPFII